jgi:hypothetical protein
LRLIEIPLDGSSLNQGGIPRENCIGYPQRALVEIFTEVVAKELQGTTRPERGVV